MTCLNPSLTPVSISSFSPRYWLPEAMRRSTVLTVFALILWAAMLPTLVAWGLDDRLLRGVSVWAKPLKFMASLGLFALSTAWLMGLLAPKQRDSLSMRVVEWTIVASSTFEVVYITLMAALGQASHFNFTSPFSGTMYMLMGVGATALTATQALLAWHIARQVQPGLPTIWRDSVVLGLVLTFVLGAGAGGLLSSVQPPAGVGLPIVGWHLTSDLRPAHFLGIHAQQMFPMMGLLLAWAMPAKSRLCLAAFALAYIALFAWAIVQGLS